MSKYPGITVLQQPIQADCLEWAFKHPDCDTIFDGFQENTNQIKIFAYANSADGNVSLKKYRREKLKDKEIIAGLSTDAINKIL